MTNSPSLRDVTREPSRDLAELVETVIMTGVVAVSAQPAEARAAVWWKIRATYPMLFETGFEPALRATVDLVLADPTASETLPGIDGQRLLRAVQAGTFLYGLDFDRVQALNDANEAARQLLAETRAEVERTIAALSRHTGTLGRASTAEELYAHIATGCQGCAGCQP